VGTVVGGAVPLVMDAGKGIGRIVRQVVNPMTEKGRTAILRELQDDLLANDPHLRAIARDALSRAKPGVGGVMPTAGEVLAGIKDPELAAKFTGLMQHQKNVSTLAGVSPQFAARSAAQVGAREAEIGTIAKTPQALEAALLARKSAADPLYLAARAGGNVVDARPIMRHINETLQRNPGNRELVNELSNIKRGLTDSSGHLRTDAEEVGSVMDGLKRAIADENNKFIGKNLTTIKEMLAKAIPGYETAQQTFATMSGPPNRMQVGQKLADAITSPLGTHERSGVFATAVQNEPGTIKNAIGQPLFRHLDEILHPREMQSVRKVAEELSRKDTFERLARQTSLSGKNAIPGSISLPIPNLLYRPAMLTNFMLQHVAKGAEQKIAKLAEGQYLQPNQLAAALEDIPPRYAPMMNAMRQRVPALAGAAMGRATQ
jgi:hypothetical protein